MIIHCEIGIFNIQVNFIAYTIRSRHVKMVNIRKIVEIIETFVKIYYIKYDNEYRCPGRESNTSGTVIVANKATVSVSDFLLS